MSHDLAAGLYLKVEMGLANTLTTSPRAGLDLPLEATSCRG